MNEIASTQNLTHRQEEEVAIMFSGGTDSTLTAAIFGMACKAAERVAMAREYLEIHFHQQPLPFLEITPQTHISNP